MYFANGFSSRHAGHDKPGEEIPVAKTWHIPEVYACGKGLDLFPGILPLGHRDPTQAEKSLPLLGAKSGIRPRPPVHRVRGDSIPFTHPVTGQARTLTVVEYETQQMDAGHFQDKDRWEYPTHYTALSYVVEPELPGNR